MLLKEKLYISTATASKTAHTSPDVVTDTNSIIKHDCLYLPLRFLLAPQSTQS